MYVWPSGESDCVMHESLDIAMDYLLRTGQAVFFREVQAKAAETIVSAWHKGMRNRLKLANCAIHAIEQERSLGEH